MADHYKRYSLLDFGESMLPDASPRAARYERGLSEMVTEACPDIRSLMGSPLPTRKMALQVQRDLGSDGAATAGGNLMPVGILATVEAARPPLVFEHLGARILTITSEKNTSLPTLTVEVSGGWVNEFAPAPSFSQLTIKSAALSAKQASARVGYSRRLRASSPDGAAFEASVLREVSRAVRQVLENGLINGTGYSGEPQGIVNTTGRQTKSFAGSVPTLSELVDMFELLGQADADLSTSAWLLHPSMVASLLETQHGTNTDTIMRVTGPREWLLLGLPVQVSTQVPSGSVVLADWSKVTVCNFGPSQVLVDGFSGGKSIRGDVELIVSNFVDIALAEVDNLVIGSA